MPVIVVGAWVKGHYTGKKREIQHDLNKKADDLASTHLKNPPTKFRPLKCPCAPPGYQVRLLFHSSVITSKFYHTLTKLKHNKSLKQHIMKKTNWTELTFSKVDWMAHKSAFNQLTRFQQITTAKLIHKLANVNTQNQLYYKTDPHCPMCFQDDEDFVHVLTCSDPRATQNRQELLLQLKTDLTNIQTPKIVTQTILQGFHLLITPPSTRSRAPTVGSLAGPDILLTAAYQEQFHTLSWYQCCLGRITSNGNKQW
jgi:hypothetical protein